MTVFRVEQEELLFSLFNIFVSVMFNQRLPAPIFWLEYHLLLYKIRASIPIWGLRKRIQQTWLISALVSFFGETEFYFGENFHW